MNKQALLKFAVLFMLVYLALLALSLQLGQYYVEFMLPLYRWEIGWLSPDYRIISLAFADDRSEGVVALTMNLISYIVVAGHALPPGGNISSSTLSGHALQHPLVMLSLLVALPASNISHRIALLSVAAPLLLMVEIFDVPLVLLGSIEDLILANIAPDTSSILVMWMNFMNGGGRLAFSIVAALAAYVAGRILSRTWLSFGTKI